MQEPSAMKSAGTLCDYPFSEDTKVLDMCAAPGGKTGQVAAYMQGRGIIVSNEIVTQRAAELAKNVERLGITNAVITNSHPEKIAQHLPQYFDIVIVDAPCSGEGMFRKNPAAVTEWSPEHVKSCAARQEAILDTAAKCVKKGGIIVYSTCTFSEQENELTTRKFAKEHDFDIVESERLYPHKCCGEGHFVCVMKCNSDTTVKNGKKDNIKSDYSVCKDKMYNEFIKDTFVTPPAMTAYMNDSGKVILANEEMLRIAKCLQAKSCGVHVGYVKNFFDPSHTLFMASGIGAFRLQADFECTSDKINAFLHGESIESPFDEKEKGYCLVSCNGLPIGFAKVVDGMLKNKLPKGLRVM